MKQISIDKLVNYVPRRLALARYDLARVNAEQDALFERAGLPLEAGRELLRPIARDRLGREYDPGRDSIHWLVFACLAARDASSVKNILEIGTFDGQFTNLLATLFPGAQIVSYDLPEHDPVMRSTYGREADDALDIFRRKQQRNLDLGNIDYRTLNSFWIPQNHKPQAFDLVWVDGGHLNPVVAWDLCNAYHLCAPGGVICCDDVVLDPNGLSNEYVSPESAEILDYVATRTGEGLYHFLKRRYKGSAAWAPNRKFVSMLAKAGDR